MFFKKEVIKEVEVSKKSDLLKIEELTSEIKQIKKDFESDKRISNREIAVKISEAIEEKNKELNKVQQENAVLLKEVSILEKAFENMGFDVKDMKEILNKLVDGIVSKNEINVIK